MSETLGKTTEARLIRAALALVFVGGAYLYVRFVDKLSDAFSDATVTLGLSFATMGLIVTALFLINLFWFVPAALWGEQINAIADLERSLRPRFSVLANFGARRYDFGATHRSPYTGSAQSVVQHTINALAIDVTNETHTTLERCEAYLSRFEELGGEPGVFHSMRLGWVPVGDEVSVVDIPPSGQRTVIVFQVVGNRAVFSHDKMPVQAVHMIKEDGIYYGVVTLSAKNAAAAYAAFRLTCIKGEPPLFSLMRRGFNEVEFIGWAPETFIGI